VLTTTERLTSWNRNEYCWKKSQSDFSLYTASVGMVAFQGLAWIKQVTDTGLLEHSRITASFAAPSLFPNTGEPSGSLGGKGDL